MNRPIVLLLISLGACATSKSLSEYEQVAAPDQTARALAIRKAEAERKDFNAVLIRLDQMMESYANALNNRGVDRVDAAAERIERMLRETVLDQGTARVGEVAYAAATNNNFQRLQAAAIDGSEPYQQGIALAALGFSGDQEVMSTILQGAQLEDPALIDRAVFGLAMLRAPQTPPGVLAAIIDNPELQERTRSQAAWALYRIQDVSQSQQQISTIWRRLAATGRDNLPTGVIVQVVRGLGLTRDAANADLVVPYLRNPFPLVRLAAAAAIARMNSQRHAEDLIAMLGPEESVPNVRLGVRKALQQLAGRVDYGYDVTAWRKAFERK
ncbi:MAG: hypothetical protein KDC98_03430 [Planctomycetes bacterium]|nr:hypothetical protein [Planctomycetota bacterium]